jgi:hypothetical protein
VLHLIAARALTVVTLGTARGAAEGAGSAGAPRAALHADGQPRVELIAGRTAALETADGVDAAGAAAAGIRLRAALVLSSGALVPAEPDI